MRIVWNCCSCEQDPFVYIQDLCDRTCLVGSENNRDHYTQSMLYMLPWALHPTGRYYNKSSAWQMTFWSLLFKLTCASMVRTQAPISFFLYIIKHCGWIQKVVLRIGYCKLTGERTVSRKLIENHEL